MVLCLGEPPGGFSDVGCCSSFKLFLWCWLLLFLRFRATFSCHRDSTFTSRAREGLHHLWALPWLISISALFRHIFTASATVSSGHFLPTEVFYLTLLPDIWHNLLLSKTSLGAGSSSLRVPGPPAEIQNTDPAHLFVWITQCSAKGFSR